MTPERWRQIEQLYQTALERGAAERPRLLDEVCAGDDGLRREIESLLAFDQGGEHFMDALPGDVVAGLLVKERAQSIAGRILGRYRILSPLGAGAMGEVYLAQDTHLERKAALKLLRPTFTRDQEQVQRFKQEAHSASALNHPNIVTIFEIGEADEFHFIATEFVDGQTLHERMSTAPLTLPEALDIAIQVAGALSAAHDAGIVHRDVKPANIMLRRDGYVKVVDFGLAKLIERHRAHLGTGDDLGGPGWEQVHTHPGWVLGTPRYMSPEQVLAEQLDGRSDIFSLGVVLYELVSGRPPFVGSTTSELIREVLTKEAPPLPVPADNAFPELERIVRKALAKDREQRYQTARDLLADLSDLKLDIDVELKRTRGRTESDGSIPPKPEAPSLGPRGWRTWSHSRLMQWPLVAVGTAALALVAAALFGTVWPARGGRNPQLVLDKPSIAVLPFVDMSPDKSEEYLSDGLSEEVRNALGKIGGLRVTGRASSFQFKGKAEDSRVVGKKLNVATILEGSVRKQGTRARISVQLIKSRDGFQLWSETYDREMKDIFAVYDEIARAVTAALRVRLLGGMPAGTSVKSTSIEAYISCLQARYFYGRRNKPDLEKAADYFVRATKLDPAYAPAWAGLGRSRVAQADRGYVPEKEGYRQGREAVERALALDPDLAEAHAIMGSIRKDHDWDWIGADESYKRALALAPGNASVVGGAGDLVWILGRPNEAIALYRRAIEIDPLDNNFYFNLGLILDSAGRQEEARVALAKALELAPEMDGAHFALCRIYLTQSQPQQALAEAEKEKHAVFRLLGLALAYYTLGRKESDTNLAELIAKFTADDPYQIADVYAFRGEADKAFEWLERAYGAHDPGLIEIKGDPLLNRVKGDPRYAALLRNMGLPQ